MKYIQSHTHLQNRITAQENLLKLLAPWSLHTDHNAAAWDGPVTSRTDFLFKSKFERSYLSMTKSFNACATWHPMMRRSLKIRANSMKIRPKGAQLASSWWRRYGLKRLDNVPELAVEHSPVTPVSKKRQQLKKSELKNIPGLLESDSCSMEPVSNHWKVVN